MANLDLVSVRTGNERDEAFIYDTWMEGLYHGNPAYKRIDKRTFMKKYRPVIDRLLEVSNQNVACLKESPDVILGYSITQGPKLHWIFVKTAWRGLKIGKLLLPVGFSTVTHETYTGRKILREKYPDVIYDPFL